MPTLPESQVVEGPVEKEKNTLLQSVNITSTTRDLIALMFIKTLTYEDVAKLKADVPGCKVVQFLLKRK